MKLRMFIALAIFFSVSNLLLGQENSISKYTSYVDAGSIGYYSSIFLNAERCLSENQDKNVAFFGRLGLGYLDARSGQFGWSGMGAFVSLIGTEPHYLEVTGGISIGANQGLLTESSVFTLPYFDLGYRFQRKNGLLFRVKAGLLGAGVGVGYAF